MASRAERIRVRMLLGPLGIDETLIHDMWIDQCLEKYTPEAAAQYFQKVLAGPNANHLERK